MKEYYSKIKTRIEDLYDSLDDLYFLIDQALEDDEDTDRDEHWMTWKDLEN